MSTNKKSSTRNAESSLDASLFNLNQSSILNTTLTSSINNQSFEVPNFDGSRVEHNEQQFEPNVITTAEQIDWTPQTKSLFAGFKMDMTKTGLVQATPLKEIIDLGMSKQDIYRAFTQKGKLFLPPESMCNFAYFTGLLTGEKLAFTTKEIVLAQVPQYKELSLEKILAIGLSNPTVAKYLPELPNGKKQSPNRVDRTFLFSVMNTIDPNFFPAAILEVEENLIKPKLSSDGVINVDPAMLHILKQYVQTHKMRNKRSSLTLIKAGSRKRKRAVTRTPIEIKTAFGKMPNSNQKKLH